MRRLVLLSSLALLACGTGEKKAADSSSAAAPAQNWVTIMAQEFTFDAPDTLPAGFTRVNLMNHGAEPHHLLFARLDSGHVLGELLQELGANKIPTWVSWLGGPNAAMPGATTETVVELTPGNYAVLCVIPTADGTPHVAKGMVRPLTVKAATAATIPPTPDVDLTLTDYTFSVDKPITVGPHVIRVQNQAEQPHELVLVRLEPGKTVQEFAKWIEKPQGPPLGAVIGGTSPQSKGVTNYVMADFSPGSYGFICFLPDAKDGKPHLVHGMINQFKVN